MFGAFQEQSTAADAEAQLFESLYSHLVVKNPPRNDRFCDQPTVKCIVHVFVACVLCTFRGGNSVLRFKPDWHAVLRFKISMCFVPIHFRQLRPAVPSLAGLRRFLHLSEDAVLLVLDWQVSETVVLWCPGLNGVTVPLRGS